MRLKPFGASEAGVVWLSIKLQNVIFASYSQTTDDAFVNYSAMGSFYLYLPSLHIHTYRFSLSCPKNDHILSFRPLLLLRFNGLSPRELRNGNNERRRKRTIENIGDIGVFRN